jgi:peptide subunit release factor 1 (eRF1)
MTTRRELAATIDTLRSRRGHQTGMVSMYVPPTARVGDVRAYVRKEMVESENVKDKVNRKNVLSGLTSIFS